jgi:RNA polymerase sigma factor (sigma-70 family)
MNPLVETHMLDATKRAHSLSRRFNYPFDELRQELMVVLLESVRDFRPSRRVPFYPYLQQRMTWHAYHVIFPKRELNRKPPVSLDETNDEGKPYVMEKADLFYEKQELTEFYGVDRFWNRVSEVTELIDSSPALSSTERKVLTAQFIEGLETDETAEELALTVDAVKNFTAQALRKIRQLLKVNLPVVEQPKIDRAQLITDMLEIFGDQKACGLLEMARRLNLLSNRPYQSWSDGRTVWYGWLDKELKLMGVKTFLLDPSRAGTKFNPRLFRRDDLRLKNLPVGSDSCSRKIYPNGRII